VPLESSWFFGLILVSLRQLESTEKESDVHYALPFRFDIVLCGSNGTIFLGKDEIECNTCTEGDLIYQ
jgi:hypothetical protein